MFEEVEDEDMAMIDSITEEDEDSDDRPQGLTLSEVLLEGNMKLSKFTLFSYFLSVP